MTQPEFSPILKRTSTMAVISLIAGLSFFIGLPIIGSVVAVVTGNMALKEIRNSQGMIVGDGMARVGLIVGWFGLVVWGLGLICGLLGIFIPAAGAICTSIFPFLAEILRTFR